VVGQPEDAVSGNQETKKGRQMKTQQTLIKTGLRLAAAAAIAIVLTYTSVAADIKTGKGGAGDLLSKPISTVADIDALKPGDTVAMACPKCKSVYVTTVVKENKPAKTYELTTEKHACPGCGNTFEVTGHGKAKTEKV